jgi:hypothetical protein
MGKIAADGTVRERTENMVLDKRKSGPIGSIEPDGTVLTKVTVTGNAAATDDGRLLFGSQRKVFHVASGDGIAPRLQLFTAKLADLTFAHIADGVHRSRLSHPDDTVSAILAAKTASR